MLDALLHLLKSNPLLAGAGGMAVMGWVMVQAKSLPVKLWRIIQDQFSATVTIYSEDQAFRLVNVWLSKHPSIKHSRRFGITSWWNPHKDEDDFVLTPGTGYHLLRDGWRFYLVHRQLEQSQGFSNDRKQTVSITTHGRSQAPLRQLFSAIMAVREDHETIPVYSWVGNSYSLIERRTKRPMETVYIDEPVKRDLITDIQRFQSRRIWYAERAIPWRRGYMIIGPPGTGKSSLIFAVASMLEKSVYLINLAALDNDNQLQSAVNAAGSGLIALEDIDTVKISATREIKVKAQRAALAAPVANGVPAPPSDGADNSKSGITLSGLLNALDGLGAREGRMLFITSNHPELLDPALIRPGRVDKQYHLEYIQEVQALEMYNRFFPETPVEKLPIDIQEALPISPADLQNRLLSLAEAA